MPKVLVADDSATIRGVAESLLRQNGYEVISSSDGSKALAMAKGQKPDLIFLDHFIPGKDGLSVCRELKSDPKFKNIPVVMLLGASEMKDAEKFLKAGADDCLFKPFVPKDFIEKAHKFLTTPGGKPDLEEDTDKLSSTAVLEEALASLSRDEDLNLDELLEEALSKESEEAKRPTAGPEKKSLLETELGRRPAEKGEEMTVKLYPSDPPQKTKPTEKFKVPSKTGRAQPDSDKLKLEMDKEALVLSSNPFGLGQDELEFAANLAPEKEVPHDYDWFLKEMQKETAAPPDSPPASSLSKPPLSPKKKEDTSEELKLKVEEMGTSRLGYERFINEFKKEMMKLETEEKPVYGETKIDPQAVVAAQKKVNTSKLKIAPPPGSELETLPATPPQVSAPSFTFNAEEVINRLITEVAKEIALRVCSQLNQKELARLFEEKLTQLKK